MKTRLFLVFSLVFSVVSAGLPLPALAFLPLNPSLGNIPAAPSELTAEAQGSSSIKLTWQDNSSNETGFKIERNGVPIYKVLSGTNTYTDTGLEAGTTYTYRVRAYNYYGDSAPSNEATATTWGAGKQLSPPYELTATPLSSSEIRLAWKYNFEEVKQMFLGFIIDRNGEKLMDQTVPGFFTDFLDKGLEAGRTYTYRVMAKILFVTSDFSNEATATTLPESSPPQAPPLPLPVTPDSIQPAPGEQIVIRLYIGKTGYFVNNTPKTMDVAPLIREERTLLPVRYIAEAIGAGVGWDAAAQKATITMGDQLIELWLGNNTAQVNGQLKPIDSSNPNVLPVTLPPGRTMLPLRFIAENLGCQVGWNAALQEVTITATAY